MEFGINQHLQIRKLLTNLCDFARNSRREIESDRLAHALRLTAVLAVLMLTRDSQVC